MDCASAGPIDQKRLGAVNKSAAFALRKPPLAESVSDGKYAAFATPICAFAAAARRSAAGSAALAWALAALDSSARRRRPHRSISHEELKPTERLSTMRPAVVPPIKPLGERLRVIEALASSVGKSAARDWAVRADAWRNRASARSTF